MKQKQQTYLLQPKFTDIDEIKILNPNRLKHLQ